MIRAIETHYAGCRFRSRLEARWAVFLTTLGIEWEYEPQGFENRVWCDCDTPTDQLWDGSRRCNGRHDRYLPDFFLPTTNTWVEVKGSEEELLKSAVLYTDLIDYEGQLPHVNESYKTTRGLLILGPVPAIERLSPLPLHSALQHYKGVIRTFLAFTRAGLEWHDGGTWEDSCSATGGDYPNPRGLPYTETAAHAGYLVDPWVAAAYKAARSARFEHGERP